MLNVLYYTGSEPNALIWPAGACYGVSTKDAIKQLLDKYNLIKLAAEEGVSPGQACVFYGADDERVLGGGWISAARLSN